MSETVNYMRRVGNIKCIRCDFETDASVTFQVQDEQMMFHLAEKHPDWQTDGGVSILPHKLSDTAKTTPAVTIVEMILRDWIEYSKDYSAPRKQIAAAIVAALEKERAMSVKPFNEIRIRRFEPQHARTMQGACSAACVEKDSGAFVTFTDHSDRIKESRGELFTLQQNYAAVLALARQQHEAFEVAREAILKERGALEGERLTGEQINSVLSELDSAFCAALAAGAAMGLEDKP